eukprot:CAMPEP_0117737704 /NCGR_PEP_ID=MMETSP0947-20121206/2691_1 /TAXON_ID=44440 /ORGANISM="Chattonella subsalsa, Strain CCMP2191" /LENGTH=1550 /DNA_ID=CAMNT_0005553251 /DNA_START=325 /DNA_END=4977 /DNA_ORIENTATION=+
MKNLKEPIIHPSYDPLDPKHSKPGTEAQLVRTTAEQKRILKNLGSNFETPSLEFVDALEYMTLLDDHNATVLCCSWAHTGTKLATGSWNGKVVIYSLSAGANSRKTLMPHTGAVNACCFSSDGKYLATGGFDGQVVIFQTRFFSEETRFQAHRMDIRAVAFSHDSVLLASGSWDGTVELWDTENWQKVGTLKGEEGGVNTLSWSMKSASSHMQARALATGSDNGKVLIWREVLGGEGALEYKRAVIEGTFGDRVTSIGWSPVGNLIAVATLGASVGLYETRNFQLVRKLQTPACHEARTVAWDSLGLLLAVGYGDTGVVVVWDTDLYAEVYHLKGHTEGVNQLAFRPFSKTPVIASVGADWKAIVWNTEAPERAGYIHAHKAVVNCCAYSPDGDLIATGGSDSFVKVWEADQHLECGTFNHSDCAVLCLSWSSDCLLLASGAWDSSIAIYDVRENKQIANLDLGSTSMAKAIAFSSAANFLATPFEDSVVAVWSYDHTRGSYRFRLVAELTGHQQEASAFAWSSDGSRLITCSADPRTIVWDFSNRTKLKTIDSYLDPITSCAFSPNGRMLATSTNAELMIWDSTTLEELSIFPGPLNDISDFAWSPDSRFVCLGGGGGRAAVWDVKTLREVPYFGLLADMSEITSISARSNTPSAYTTPSAGTIKPFVCAVTTANGHLEILDLTPRQPSFGSLLSVLIFLMGDPSTDGLWGVREELVPDLCQLASKYPSMLRVRDWANNLATQIHMFLRLRPVPALLLDLLLHLTERYAGFVYTRDSASATPLQLAVRTKSQDIINRVVDYVSSCAANGQIEIYPWETGEGAPTDSCPRTLLYRDLLMLMHPERDPQAAIKLLLSANVGLVWGANPIGLPAEQTFVSGRVTLASSACAFPPSKLDNGGSLSTTRDVESSLQRSPLATPKQRILVKRKSLDKWESLESKRSTNKSLTGVYQLERDDASFKQVQTLSFGLPDLTSSKLLQQLNLVNQEHFFELPLVQLLCEFKWKAFVRQKFLKNFAEYAIFLMVLSVHVSNNAQVSFSQWLHHATVAILLLFTMSATARALRSLRVAWKDANRNLMNETRFLRNRAMKRCWLAYKSVKKQLEWRRNIINTSVVLMTITMVLVDFLFSPGSKTARCFDTVTVLIAWLKLLQYGFGFKWTSSLMSLLVHLIEDITPFLFILLVVLLGFAMAFYAVGLSDSFGDSIVVLFVMGLGGISNEHIAACDDAHSPTLAMLLILLYLVSMAVVLLSAIIVIMEQSSERTLRHSRAGFTQQRVKLILQIENSLSSRTKEKIRAFYFAKYLHAVVPVSAFPEEQNLRSKFKKNQALTEKSINLSSQGGDIDTSATSQSKFKEAKRQKDFSRMSFQMREMKAGLNGKINTVDDRVSKKIDQLSHMLKNKFNLECPSFPSLSPSLAKERSEESKKSNVSNISESPKVTKGAKRIAKNDACSKYLHHQESDGSSTLTFTKSDELGGLPEVKDTTNLLCDTNQDSSKERINSNNVANCLDGFDMMPKQNEVGEKNDGFEVVRAMSPFHNMSPFNNKGNKKQYRI